MRDDDEEGEGDVRSESAGARAQENDVAFRRGAKRPVRTDLSGVGEDTAQANCYLAAAEVKATSVAQQNIFRGLVESVLGHEAALLNLIRRCLHQVVTHQVVTTTAEQLTPLKAPTTTPSAAR